MTEFRTEFEADLVQPSQPQESHGPSPQPRLGCSPVFEREYPASWVEWSGAPLHSGRSPQDEVLES